MGDGSILYLIHHFYPYYCDERSSFEDTRSKERSFVDLILYPGPSRSVLASSPRIGRIRNSSQASPPPPPSKTVRGGVSGGCGLVLSTCRRKLRVYREAAQYCSGVGWRGYHCRRTLLDTARCARHKRGRYIMWWLPLSTCYAPDVHTAG